MKSKLPLLGLLAALTLTAPGPVLANFGGSSEGSFGIGSFQALGTAQVVMERENLLIELYRDRARVRVQYVLRNSGAAVRVRAGFPFQEMEAYDKISPTIFAYEIKVDGAAVPANPGRRVPHGKTKHVEGFDAPLFRNWMVSEIDFAAQSARNVEITYESAYRYDYGGVSNSGTKTNDRLTYLLSTGAVWKGPIGSGRVVVRPVAYPMNQVAIHGKPARFQKEGKEYVRHFANLEPTDRDDIGIGEKLTLRLRKPTRLTHLGIANGYKLSRTHYYANNRLKGIKLVINGSHVVRAELLDDFVDSGKNSDRAYDYVPLGFSAPISTIELTIESVYPGRQQRNRAPQERLRPDGCPPPCNARVARGVACPRDSSHCGASENRSLVAAVYRDEEPVGVLDPNDLVMHQLEDVPEVVPLHRLTRSAEPFDVAVFRADPPP